MTDKDQIDPRISTMIADLRAAVVFLTAIPISALGEETGQSLDFRRSAWIFPIVGGLIGIVGGLVILIGTALGMPALVAAALAVAGIVLICGALHEDGLADTADGFGGGRTIERKLAIMNDSRIGAFGTLALILSVILRVAALAALVRADGLQAAAALIAAEAASRGAMVRLWHDLPAARPGGISDRAGRPDDQATLVAAICSLVIAAVAIVPAFGFVAAIVAVLVLIIASFCFARLAIDQIGGQTGDILGACQQITATTLLIVLTAFG